MDPLDGEAPQTPREIRCPACGRVLLALRLPCCNWCGAAIPGEDYQIILAQSQPVMTLPESTSLPPITSYSQQAEWAFGQRRISNRLLPSAVRSFQPATPGQARLRVIVVALCGLFAGAGICYYLYALWMLHRLIHAMPH